MPAQTLSDAFQSAGRVDKIVSVNEFKAKRAELEAKADFNPWQRLRLAFNQNALISFTKARTIDLWRTAHNKLASNNLAQNIFVYAYPRQIEERPINHQLSHVSARQVTSGERFMSGLAFAGGIDIASPRHPLHGSGFKAKQADILLKAFDACEDYAPWREDGQLMPREDAKHIMVLPSLQPR